MHKSIFYLIGLILVLNIDYFSGLYKKPHGLGVLFLLFAACLRQACLFFPLTITHLRLSLAPVYLPEQAGNKRRSLVRT